MTNRAAKAANRVLSLQEVRDYLEHPIAEGEREDVLALVRWFRRRYPTPVERLQYVRQAYARWLATRSRAGREPI